MQVKPTSSPANPTAYYGLQVDYRARWASLERQEEVQQGKQITSHNCQEVIPRTALTACSSFEAHFLSSHARKASMREGELYQSGSVSEID